MSPISPAARRAEEFASLLSNGGTSARHADALAVVSALRTVPAARPSAAYVNELRSNLLAAADTLLAPVPMRSTLVVPAVAPQRRPRKVAIAATTLAVLGGTTGVAMAAQNALPGDSLYPIKRILESAQTSLSADDAERADRILGLALDRLSETEALAASDSSGSRAEIPRALADFVDQSDKAAEASLAEYAESGDAAVVLKLRDFIAASLTSLAGIKGSVPAAYADDFEAAVAALLHIDELILSSCSTCGGLLDIPSILLSGAPIQPLGGDAVAAPTTDPTTTNVVRDLLAGLPALDAATPTPSTSPEPTTSTSPTADPTDAVTGLFGEGSVTEPLTDALEGLLDPVLGPLLDPFRSAGGL